MKRIDSIYKLSIVLNVIDNLSGQLSRPNRELSAFEENVLKLNTSFINMTKSGFAMATMGKEIVEYALAPVGALFETKQALGELSSVGITDLKALEKAGEEFSSAWSGTTKAEFISSAYDIKSGISSLSDEAVAEYTKIAGITAKGTKASVDEMTSLFATGYGIYKDYYSDLSDMEFAEMFSAGIATSVKQFKTDGSQMSDALKTLGASATSANVPFEEQLSILGMLQATMSGSEASTKYKAFLQSAAKAGDDLGLSFTDANNQLLSMPEILEQLKFKFGDTIDAGEKMQLQEAFGSAEAVALIDLLYNKTDSLQGNIVDMYGSLGQGIGVATDMANAINDVEGSKYEIIQQKIQNITETVGNGMLPTINTVLDKVDVFVTKIGDWVSENEELAGNIMLIVAGLGVLITTLGGLKIAGGLIGLAFTTPLMGVSKLKTVMLGIPSAFDTIALKGMYAKDAVVGGFGVMKSAGATALTGVKNFGIGIFNMGRQALTTAMTSLPPLIASVWSFTTALLANPITWIVIAIIALIGALYLLWRNWDTVVAWLNNVWNACINGVVNAFQWIKDKINEVPTSVLALIAIFAPFLGIPLLIMQNWGAIKEFFSGLWTNITQGFTNFFTNWIPNLLQSGKKIMSTLAEGIKQGAMAPVNALSDGFTKMRQLLPFSDAKEGPLSSLTLSGSKIFSTLGEGMELTKDIPADLTNQAFNDISIQEMNARAKSELLTSNNEKTVNSELFSTKTKESELIESEKSGASISIGNLNISFDIKSLEDIKFIKLLVDELKDLHSQNDADIDTEVVTA